MTFVNIFTFTLVILTGAAVNHAYPTLEEWPEQCKGRTYCNVQPNYYPKDRFAQLLDGEKLNFVQGETVGNRSGEVFTHDVARCNPRITFDKIYLILDKDENIRFVAQNKDAYSVEIEVVECQNPGPTNSSVLDEDALKDYSVNCHETRIPFRFPVLKLDGSDLEAVAPKDGLSVACSAKVMQKS